jgi:hypothetical protein
MLRWPKHSKNKVVVPEKEEEKEEDCDFLFARLMRRGTKYWY